MFSLARICLLIEPGRETEESLCPQLTVWWFALVDSWHPGCFCLFSLLAATGLNRVGVLYWRLLVERGRAASGYSSTRTSSLTLRLTDVDWVLSASRGWSASSPSFSLQGVGLIFFFHYPLFSLTADSGRPFDVVEDFFFFFVVVFP